MKTSYHILCLEDDLRDQQLLEGVLTADSLVCEFVHAQTQNEFEAALGQTTYDLIISDYTRPSYDGMNALAVAQKTQPETPFLFVSGTIGEERAVESLKKGATDYVLKDRPDRLISAVRRALRESQEREERKQLEVQLRQAQKMEAIGQLAGGVAHDFNNLLAVIQGNADLALMDAKETSETTREHLKQITAATERAAGLTRQLLASGRKQTLQRQPHNLNDVIGNLTKMLNRIIGEDICLHCNYVTRLAFVQADVGMMEQVIVNLVVNARDAMPQGGKLEITTELVDIDEPYIRVHPEARLGGYVCLSVSDTGTGIAPEHLPQIFVPFFTTKEPGKGTGLGLATVYGIVKQHQGWIDLTSQVGEGTTFKIFLPAIEPPANVEVEKAKLSAQGGTETILLVEDDQEVRSMTRRILESYGYHVLQAASGREALEMWREQSANINLLLTDIIMPGGMTGRELAERLCAQQPKLKVVFVSGYSTPTTEKDTDFFRRSDIYFIQKPFSSIKIIQTVRQCLDDTRNGSGTV